MITPHSASSTIPAGSVLDGDPRILIPLPEAAARLGISRWQAYKLARSGRLRQRNQDPRVAVQHRPSRGSGESGVGGGHQARTS